MDTLAKNNGSKLSELKTETRRQFIGNLSTGLGALALGSMIGCDFSSSSKKSNPQSLSKLPNFVPSAKRVIYLHMAGAPSQLELFDYKPQLVKYNGMACPKELMEGKRFAFLRGIPKLMGPYVTSFKQYGESGAWVSNHMPHVAERVDDICFLKAMHTNEFNHAPAQLFMHTGSPRLGRPSIGSWVTYGLGSENENLPGFIVLASGGKTPDAGKSVWGSGFLPSVYQGVQCRSQGDPVLYVSDPHGMDRPLKGKIIETINEINTESFERINDPEIKTRIDQYEMAFKMQVSVPEAMDISKEPESIREMYGAEPGESSFANNCLLARRLIEKGVRFVQLFHWGWDSHGIDAQLSLNHGFVKECKSTDKPIAALLQDLKQRGLLEDTLVVWGGEFGRTPMQEVRADATFLGRDHHLEAFTMWMAGGGAKPGITYGETDDIGYYGVKNKVHVHDFHATMLHLLGFDHEKFTYPYQGRNFRLTDVAGKVVSDVIA
jgi:hypothetical protein